MQVLRKVWETRDIPERLHPGEPEPATGSPGSIEQQLDMVENGDLRGDQVLYDHGANEEREDFEIRPDHATPIDILMARNNYEMNLGEPDREGVEMSGDDHTYGLQGGEEELHHQAHISSGLPGEESEKDENWQRPVSDND